MIKRIRQILFYPEWWLIVIPIIAYWQIALFHNTMQWDMTDQVFVWHRFISECFHQHFLPLWSPYSRLGYPFFADPQGGLFYPAIWLFTYFFDYSLYSNNLEFVTHVVGAAFGMRFLLRSLDIDRYTACSFGLVYALSGPFVSNASHIVFIYSLCWIPFILGSYIRMLKTADYRYALLMALFLFLGISGGYIGLSIILFYVLIFVFLYYMVFVFSSERQRFKDIVVNHIILSAMTFLLSAGFVYAVYIGLPFIDRQGGVSLGTANSIAFTPVSFLTFLYPAVANNDFLNFGTDVTMRNVYVGSLTLLLVIVSCFSYRRFRLVLLAGSILFLLAALGAATPMRGWLYSYVPLMNMFRMASIFRFFACMGFIMLAAFGFDDIFEKRNEMSMRVLKTSIVILVSLVIVFLCATLSSRGKQLYHPVISSLADFTDFLKHTSSWTVICYENIVHLVILLSAFLFLMRLRLNHVLQKYLLAGLLIFDLTIAIQGNMFSTIANVRSLRDVQYNLDKLPKGFPVVSNLPLLTFNQWNDSTLAPPIWHNGGFIHKQITFDGYNGYNLKSYNELSERKDFYEILSAQKFISTSPDSAKIMILRSEPGEILFKTSSSYDISVSIGQLYFPGWKVNLDRSRQSSAMMQDSLHLLKCEIPHGNHIVEMTFEPTGVKFIFIYTVVVFMLSLVCTVALFVRSFI